MYRHPDRSAAPAPAHIPPAAALSTLRLQGGEGEVGVERAGQGEAEQGEPRQEDCCAEVGGEGGGGAEEQRLAEQVEQKQAGDKVD